MEHEVADTNVYCVGREGLFFCVINNPKYLLSHVRKRKCSSQVRGTLVLACCLQCGHTFVLSPAINTYTTVMKNYKNTRHFLIWVINNSATDLVVDSTKSADVHVQGTYTTVIQWTYGLKLKVVLTYKDVYIENAELRRHRCPV